MKRLRKPRSITVFFTTAVFLIIVSTVLLIGGALVALVLTGVIDIENPDSKSTVIWIVALFAGACIIVGTTITFLSGRVPLRPIYKVVDALNRLGAGDYTTRINFGDLEAARPVEESFNSLAAELEKNELLRTDFINDFSHEFKTPIASISGFAKLLRNSELPREKQLEYLRIIEEESRRLAVMATNILNLTRLENQEILTGITEYNLSEQLRGCLLMLESKWTEKQLSFSLPENECTVKADTELMKQVWLNLLDNAVKFAPKNGSIAISVEQDNKKTVVSVGNNGKRIPAERTDKIFNKFYQADESHSKEGNGIGLAIVKRIVTLHKGSIAVSSTPEWTEFTVTLPCI